MTDSRQQDPPSRPRQSSSGGTTRGGHNPFDPFARAQTIGALLLGITLVALPLYLWRRPRSTQAPARSDAGLTDASRDGAQPLAPTPDAAPSLPVRVAEARVLECHDKGPGRTPPEQCDHIPAFEKAMNYAILASHACVPKDAGAGTIEYVADVSFGRRHNPITIALPHDGRSFQSAKISRDCLAGVRSQLHAFPLAPLPHAHTRYKIAAVATYAGSSVP